MAQRYPGEDFNPNPYTDDPRGPPWDDDYPVDDDAVVQEMHRRLRANIDLGLITWDNHDVVYLQTVLPVKDGGYTLYVLVRDSANLRQRYLTHQQWIPGADTEVLGVLYNTDYDILMLCRVGKPPIPVVPSSAAFSSVKAKCGTGPKAPLGEREPSVVILYDS